MVVTGGFMFASEATKMYENGAFRFKMYLIVLAGLNALLFERVTFRNVSSWDVSAKTPGLARMAACISLLAWIGVIAAGRWIAYW